MGEENDKLELKHPLSLWEKIKIGVGSFVRSVAHYIPRALIMTLLMFGGLALLVSTTGCTGPWGLLEGLANLNVAGFIGKVAIGIGLGSAMVGGFSAYQSITANNEFRNKEIELQEKALLRARAQAKQLEQQQEYSGGYSPHNSLPHLGTAAELLIH